MAFLASCAGDDHALNMQKYADIIDSDVAYITAMQSESLEKNTFIFSFDEAVSRAKSANLDARTAAFEAIAEQSDITVEQLKALPSMNSEATRTGRSNIAGSSSRSLASGLQSLEPSQSSDQYSTSANIAATWNLIDVALAYVSANTARDEWMITKFRHDKVLQNIERDVLVAYMKLYTYHQVKEDLQGVLDASARHVQSIEHAQSTKIINPDEADKRAATMREMSDQVNVLSHELQLADIEFKSLLSLPMESRVVLDGLPVLNIETCVRCEEAYDTLDHLALNHRPEMREAMMNKNIAVRSVREEVIRSIPGVSLFWSENYDGNSFLDKENWSSYNAAITQQVTSLLTLPARLKQARKKEYLADMQRRSLAFAIMAQIRIAKNRIGLSHDRYDSAQEALSKAQADVVRLTAKKKMGVVSGEQLLNGQLNFYIKAIEKGLAQADRYDALVTFENTLGYGIQNFQMTGTDTGGVS